MSALLLTGAFLAPLPGVRAHAASPPPPPAAACPPASPGVHGNAWPLVQSNNDFGLRLYHRLASVGPNKNVFISPLSIALALEMAYNGSTGNTSRAMARTLGLGAMSPSRVRYLAASLLTGLTSHDPGVQVSVANSLWANAGVPIRQLFLDTAQRSFGARVTTIPFSSPAALPAINGWVSCATFGRIRSILTWLDPAQVLILINALYFHGDWTVPFISRDTYRQLFHATTATRRVPFMHTTQFFSYLGTQTFQAVSLPYGNGRYSLVVVLPRPAMSLARVERDLSQASWRTWMTGLKATDVDLSVPRFQIKNSFDLTPTLSAMGLRPALGPGANFSEMCTRGCGISRIFHKTYLQVNERGTTAAAVTVVAPGGGFPPPRVEHMVVDRPFLTAIRDRSTGSLLFFGRISDPTK